MMSIQNLKRWKCETIEGRSWKLCVMRWKFLPSLKNCTSKWWFIFLLHVSWSISIKLKLIPMINVSLLMLSLTHFSSSFSSKFFPLPFCDFSSHLRLHFYTSFFSKNFSDDINFHYLELLSMMEVLVAHRRLFAQSLFRKKFNFT